MSAFLWIGLGSALGGMARHGMNLLISNRWGNDFPWGTLAVNVGGALLIGVVSIFAFVPGRLALTPTAAQFCIVGVLGGFTTFSAFSLQTLELLQASRWISAALYILGSVFLCVAGVAIGQAIARAVR